MYYENLEHVNLLYFSKYYDNIRSNGFDFRSNSNLNFLEISILKLNELFLQQHKLCFFYNLN